MKCELISPEKRSYPLKRVGIQTILTGGVARVSLTQVFDCTPNADSDQIDQETGNILSAIGLKSLFRGGKWCFLLPLDGFLQVDELLIECNGAECDTELMEVPFGNEDPISSAQRQFSFYKSLLEKDAKAREATRNLKDPFYEEEDSEGKEKPAIDVSSLSMFKACSEFASWWQKESMKKEYSEIALSQIHVSSNSTVAIIKTTMIHALYRASNIVIYHFPLTTLSSLSPTWQETGTANIMPLELVVDVKLHGLTDEKMRARSYSHDVFSLGMDSGGRHLVQLSVCSDEEEEKFSKGVNDDIEQVQEKRALKEAVQAVSRDFVLVVPLKKGVTDESFMPGPGVTGIVLVIIFTIIYIIYQAKYIQARPLYDNS